MKSMLVRTAKNLKQKTHLNNIKRKKSRPMVGIFCSKLKTYLRLAALRFGAAFFLGAAFFFGAALRLGAAFFLGAAFLAGRFTAFFFAGIVVTPFHRNVWASNLASLFHFLFNYRTKKEYTGEFFLKNKLLLMRFKKYKKNKSFFIFRFKLDNILNFCLILK